LQMLRDDGGHDSQQQADHQMPGEGDPDQHSKLLARLDTGVDRAAVPRDLRDVTDRCVPGRRALGRENELPRAPRSIG
jgi:hypothetical protein